MTFYPYRRMAAVAATLFCLLFVSCLKDVKPLNTTAKSSTKPRRISAGAVMMPDLNISSVNFSDVLYYYAGYYGRTGAYSEANKTTGHRMLSEVAAAGIKSVRFFAAGSYCESCVNCPVVELWKKNRTAFYQAFDQLVSDANALGIQLIPSLVTGIYDNTELFQTNGCMLQGNILPSLPFIANLSKNEGSGCQPHDCIADPAHCSNRTGMIQYALDIVGRYANSSTILFWEIANELNTIRQDRDSTINIVTAPQIVAYVNSLSQHMKEIDPNHPICAGICDEGDGSTLNYPTDWFSYYYSQLPYVDIATVHLYDGNTRPFYQQPVATILQSFNNIAQQYGKTLYIGETGKPYELSWTGNNFNDYTMSILMAKSYLHIPLASPWDWESKNNGYADSTARVHLEMVRFSIDPGEDDDLISIIKLNNLFMWNEAVHPSTPIVGDFDGDHNTDFGVMTQRGLWDIALMNIYNPSIPFQALHNFGDSHVDPGGAPWTPITGDWDGDRYTDIGLYSYDGRWFVNFSDHSGRHFINGAQWLSNFGNNITDPGGAPFQPIIGKWNNDPYTDIGLRSRDGRWFVAFSDPVNHTFSGQVRWLSNFGNENTDPGGAPFIPITGDWNHDGYTDIGLKSKDGRWFVAFTDPVNGGFVGQAQWLSNFGNEYTDPGGAPFRPITGDWNHDGYTDIGIKSKDGRWFVAFTDPVNGGFINQVQWLSGFGNDNADPGGAPFIPITGDWDHNGFTDIGVKARNGRWATYLCNGTGFYSPKQLFE